MRTKPLPHSDIKPGSSTTEVCLEEDATSVGIKPAPQHRPADLGLELPCSESGSQPRGLPPRETSQPAVQRAESRVSANVDYWQVEKAPAWTTTLADETRQRLQEIPAGWNRFTPGPQIACGGCGSVSIATDQQIQRKVVLKRINNELLNDQAINRFLNEAQITGQLEHPGIVPVYEMGIDEQGLPFYVMKQLTGKTLAISILEQTRCTAASQKAAKRHELLHRFLSVCQTVAFAHQRGIIHRDLKPANIMVGQFGETIVLDWGLARRVATSGGRRHPGPTGSMSTSGPQRVSEQALETSNSFLTMKGAIMGTAAYMSPEQAQGLNDQLNQRSDVFSLGVILYEILAGVSPFVSTTAARTIENVVHCEYRPLLKMCSSLPRPLVAVCEKALSRHPEDRYESAQTLANEIQSFLSGQPVMAYYETTFEQFDRWAGTHRSLFRALFASTLIVALVTSVATGVVMRANLAEREAKDLAVSATEKGKLALQEAQVDNENLRRKLVLTVKENSELRERLPSPATRTSGP